MVPEHIPRPVRARRKWGLYSSMIGTFAKGDTRTYTHALTNTHSFAHIRSVTYIPTNIYSWQPHLTVVVAIWRTYFLLGSLRVFNATSTPILQSLHPPSSFCSLTIHSTSLHCTALHYTALHYTSLHCTTLHYTLLHCTTLHFTTLHFTSLHCTSIHFTALHYTTLHCTALHLFSLHFTANQVEWKA